MKRVSNRYLSWLAALFLLTGCSSVPLTGRKQVLLVSDQEVLSASLTQYSDYMKGAKKSSNTAQTQMVVRVGKKIASATEAYLKANGMSSEISLLVQIYDMPHRMIANRETVYISTLELLSSPFFFSMLRFMYYFLNVSFFPEGTVLHGRPSATAFTPFTYTVSIHPFRTAPSYGVHPHLYLSPALSTVNSLSVSTITRSA